MENLKVPISKYSDHNPFDATFIFFEELAARDQKTFILIDEIQRAPELFLAIKAQVDRYVEFLLQHGLTRRTDREVDFALRCQQNVEQAYGIRRPAGTGHRKHDSLRLLRHLFSPRRHRGTEKIP